MIEISQKALDRAEKKREYFNKLRMCIDNYICPKCGDDLIPFQDKPPFKGLEGRMGNVLKCVDCDFTWKKG